MTVEVITTLVIGVIAGGSLYGFLQFLITRHDKKDNEFDSIKEDLKQIKEEILESKRDRTRQQMLTMMYHNPKNIDTILLIAKRYFVDLKGNWYMDSEFQRWMEENEVKKPSWFKKR